MAGRNDLFLGCCQNADVDSRVSVDEGLALSSEKGLAAAESRWVFKVTEYDTCSKKLPLFSGTGAYTCMQRKPAPLIAFIFLTVKEVNGERGGMCGVQIGLSGRPKRVLRYSLISIPETGTGVLDSLAIGVKGGYPPLTLFALHMFGL